MKKIDKQKRKKKVFNRQKHPLRHRERGALESAGPVAYNATCATRLIRHWGEIGEVVRGGLTWSTTAWGWLYIGAL